MSSTLDGGDDGGGASAAATADGASAAATADEDYQMPVPVVPTFDRTARMALESPFSWVSMNPGASKSNAALVPLSPPLSSHQPLSRNPVAHVCGLLIIHSPPFSLSFNRHESYGRVRPLERTASGVCMAEQRNDRHTAVAFSVKPSWIYCAVRALSSSLKLGLFFPLTPPPPNPFARAASLSDALVAEVAGANEVAAPAFLISYVDETNLFLFTISSFSFSLSPFSFLPSPTLRVNFDYETGAHKQMSANGSGLREVRRCAGALPHSADFADSDVETVGGGTQAIPVP